MPVFRKPSFTINFDVNDEKKALRNYRDTKPGRAIPAKSNSTLLLASWNIANLGAQARQARHYKLMAGIINWFDLVAIQEVRDDLSGLTALRSELSNSWRVVFTDKAGNDEYHWPLIDFPNVLAAWIDSKVWREWDLPTHSGQSQRFRCFGHGAVGSVK